MSRHKPLMSVKDSISIRKPGYCDEGQVKNLFLKNKKGKMWLLTLHESRTIDLKEVAQVLGAGRFSFGSADLLMRYLGVVPGAVSPFALLNDHERVVKFYMDETLLSHEQIHVHPLSNCATVTLTRIDLLAFLAEQGHVYNILPLDLGSCCPAPGH